MSDTFPTDGAQSALPSFFLRTVFGDPIHPYADTFIVEGRLRVGQDHPAAYAITQARSLTPWLAGQQLITAVAKHLPYTPEQVALVLNGIDPIDHPEVASLDHDLQLKIVRLTADLLEIVSSHLSNFRTDVFSRLDDELVEAVNAGMEEVNLIPAVVDERPLGGSFALLRPTGGVFQSIAGIGLIYGNPFDLDDQVIYLLDFETTEEGSETRTAMGKVLTQLLEFRNRWNDKLLEEYFNAELEGLVKKYQLPQGEAEAPVEETISEEDTVIDDEHFGQPPVQDPKETEVRQFTGTLEDAKGLAVWANDPGEVFEITRERLAQIDEGYDAQPDEVPNVLVVTDAHDIGGALWVMDEAFGPRSVQNGNWVRKHANDRCSVHTTKEAALAAGRQ